MEQRQAPPDISEDVKRIVEKLITKQKIIVKTPRNPITHAFLLGKIINNSDKIKSCILFLVDDEFEKLNLMTYLKASQKLSTTLANSLNITHTQLSTTLLNDIKKNKKCLIILTKQEVQEKLPSKKDFDSHTIKLTRNKQITKEKLLEKLIECGYCLERTASEKGLIATRGSIVDIFATDKDSLIRIDFDDNRIDSIKILKPKQAKTQDIVSVEIIPHNLNNLPKSDYLNDYNALIKHIIFDSFPSSYDMEVKFAQSDIYKLTKLLVPQDKKKHKLPSFIKNLQNGDYVIHIDHGIAKFDGIVEQKINDISREYFKLCYAENDALFLPVTSAEKMEKYIGDPNPVLNRLSSSGWGKALNKVSIETLHHARELLNTQAKRQLSKSVEIPRANKIEQDLAKSFPYTETEDQKDVIETIFEDLSKDVPMDRLVCGDVGFGKTEIAIRAAAKVALEEFQVAVLSPTTILTQQHIDTFTERLKDLPINIAALSRFQSKQEQLKIIDQARKGKIDIIIGTHRLLSEDVKLKNLGLIVIDEEQRFGVNHKEKLKKLRSQSHVLTLTATPIPRTLHLAVSGVRAISTISTPPGGRKPINTIIESYNQKHIAKAIQEEIKRHGQVYYLYNKVKTMHLKKQELQDLLPKIKIGMLHGQMPEQEMAKVMHDFDKRLIDVLVCSTIIENGVDLPNVNTLIVDNAVQFGLSQLHQIRGRIGRGSRQAYAYFFFRRQKLTGEAEKRLNALEAAKELGSGFDIAQADMEIRGVGNVLGKAQHGHVKSIGLGLYLRLLNNAVEEIKSGAPSEMLSDISVDLPIEARIPKFFETDKQKRIELYHQWALIDSIDELMRIKDELQKEGAIPKPVENLFYILSLKILGRKARITAIDTTFASSTSKEQYITIKTTDPIDPKIFVKILDKCSHWQYGTEEIKVPKKELGSDWMKKLEICIKQLSN